MVRSVFVGHSYSVEHEFAAVLDRSDWKFVSERMSSKAAYEDDAESSYRTVAEAGEVIQYYCETANLKFVYSTGPASK
jgi:hypothetical protein